MENRELIKNPRGVKIRILIGGIITVVVGMLFSFILWFALDLEFNFERTLFVLAWLGLIGFWLASSIVTWQQWRRLQYELGTDALIVKNNKLIGKTENFYRYDSILEVRIEMGRLGQQGDYGDVHVNIPKLHKQLVLHDIDQPDKQVGNLKQVIANSGSTKALVY